MSRNSYYQIHQAHVWAVPVGGSVTTETPPANEAAWGAPLGNVTSGGLSVEVETQEMVKVVGGKRTNLFDETGESYSATFRVDELNKDVINAIFGAAQTGTEDTFLSGTRTRMVWLRMQLMNSAGTNRLLLEGVGILRPTGGDFAGENFFGVDMEIQFRGQVSGSLIGSYTV